MPAAKTNPRDFTGKQKAALEAELAEEMEAKAAEMSMLADVRAKQRETEVVDYSEGGMKTVAPEQPTPARHISPELEAELEVEVTPKTVQIRVNSKIEQMTYGRQVIKEAYVDERGTFHDAILGNLMFYDFDEGVNYRVPVELARHLDELGYLWH